MACHLSGQWEKVIILTGIRSALQVFEGIQLPVFPYIYNVRCIDMVHTHKLRESADSRTFRMQSIIIVVCNPCCVFTSMVVHAEEVKRRAEDFSDRFNKLVLDTLDILEGTKPKRIVIILKLSDPSLTTKYEHMEFLGSF